MILRNLFIAAVITISSVACNNQAAPKVAETKSEEPEECKKEDALTPTLVDGFYGTAFDTSKALTLEEATRFYKVKGIKEAKISGTIEAVCQSKGCWFDLKGASTTQSIDFGHKFLMHKDLAGKKVIACGSFYNDTTTVEQQIHEAVEDAKSMTMEQAKKKFTTPLISVGFQATGVKLLD